MDTNNDVLASRRFHSNPRHSILYAKRGSHRDLSAILQHGGNMFESVPSSLHLPLLEMLCWHLQNPVPVAASEEEKTTHRLVVYDSFLALGRFINPLEPFSLDPNMTKLLHQTCSHILRCASVINGWFKGSNIRSDSESIARYLGSLGRFMCFILAQDMISGKKPKSLADKSTLMLVAELWLRSDLSTSSQDAVAIILNTCIMETELGEMTNILEGITRPRRVAETALSRLQYASQAAPLRTDDVSSFVTTLYHLSMNTCSATFQKVLDQRGVTLILKLLLKLNLDLGNLCDSAVLQAFVFLRNSTDLSVRSAEFTCQALRDGFLEVLLKVGSRLGEEYFYEDACNHHVFLLILDILPRRLVLSSVIKAALSARKVLDPSLQSVALIGNFKGVWDGISALILALLMQEAWVYPPKLDVRPESRALDSSPRPTDIVLKSFITDVLRRRQYAAASNKHVGSVVEIIAPIGSEHCEVFLCLTNTVEQSSPREASHILENGLRLGGKKRKASIDMHGNAFRQGDLEYDEVDEVMRRLAEMAAKTDSHVYDEQLILAAVDDYLGEVADAVSLSRLRPRKLDTAA
ncbi:hypothetical protein EW145_g7874 [Phellinidium pouzarii]|uniref:Uncharacterized protein n=1 Tax=Phellinidium pouzarii TaxID=167371 RepID=A0A4S4KCZ4_9AGAM|nr:hypothetical protein EW145_g7874 [Phellinidium pouzarii]